MVSMGSLKSFVKKLSYVVCAAIFVHAASSALTQHIQASGDFAMVLAADATDYEDSSTPNTYYSTYSKFYNAEVKEGEEVSFQTVTDYVERLYQEGVNRFKTDGYENLKVYRVYFTNFKQYWYTQSGFLDATKENISESRSDGNKLSDAEGRIDSLIAKLRVDATTLDGLGLYANRIEKTETGETVVVAGADYYLTYNQFIKAENPDGAKVITYTEVARQIHNLLKEGIRRYSAGEDYDSYYKPFSNSYGYWYETSGFEKKTMAYISGARVTAVELQFASMKSTVREGKPVEAITSEVNALIDMLTTDAGKLDSLLGLSGNSSGSSGLAFTSFLGAFTILVREGLEAILIIGAIVAYLIKTGNKKQTKFVYIGAIVAIAASALLAWLLTLLNLTGIPQEIIEGVTALIAVVVLLYVSNWMLSKSETEAWTNYISKKVSKSNEKGKVFTLAFTSSPFSGKGPRSSSSTSLSSPAPKTSPGGWEPSSVASSPGRPSSSPSSSSSASSP